MDNGLDEGRDEFININLSDVDDGSEPLPEGPRHCIIRTAEKKHKQGSEYPYILVQMNPLDLPGSEKRKLRLNLSYNPAALWNMKRFLKALRIDTDKGFSLSDLIGKEVVVSVKIVPDANDDTIRRNEVNPPYTKVG